MNDMTTAVFKELGKQITKTNQKVSGLSIKHAPTSLPTRDIAWHIPTVNFVTPGTALTIHQDGNQMFGFYNEQTPAALNNTFTNSFCVVAGTYELGILGFTNIYAGIVDWYIDDVLIISSQDWYSGANVLNVIKYSNTFDIATDGNHIIKGIITDKNPLSNSYALYLTCYWLKQASD